MELADGAKSIEGVPSGWRSRVGAVKRPLVWLERSERELEIEASKQCGQSLTEDGRQALLDAGISVAVGAAATTGGTGGGKRGGDDQPLSREDQAVRTRLANVAAMKAAGSSATKYSWMTGGSSAAAAASTPAPAGVKAGAKPDKEPAATSTTTTSTTQAQQATGFGLPRPSIRRRILNARRVTVTDLLFALQHDRTRGGNYGVLRRSKAVVSAYGVRLARER